MMDWRSATNVAPGQPGIDPRWARSDKDGVGTAYSSSSQICNRGKRIRIQTTRPFRLRWTEDDWAQSYDIDAHKFGNDLHFLDLVPTNSLKFTFWWKDTETWEGRNQTIKVLPPGSQIPPP